MNRSNESMSSSFFPTISDDDKSSKRTHHPTDTDPQIKFNLLSDSKFFYFKSNWLQKIKRKIEYYYQPLLYVTVIFMPLCFVDLHKCFSITFQTNLG